MKASQTNQVSFNELFQNRLITQSKKSSDFKESVFWGHIGICDRSTIVVFEYGFLHVNDYLFACIP